MQYLRLFVSTFTLKINRRDHEIFHAQSGIAVGTIVFVVAVLALIAAAIAAGSGSYTGGTSNESASTAAGAILNYADLVATAVQRVSIEHSCSANQINFVNPLVSGYTNANAPSDNTCNVFDPAGGGIVYQRPPTSYLDSSNSNSLYFGDYLFSGANQLYGWDSTGSLMLFLPYVPFATCQKINTLVSFPVLTTAFVPWINSQDTVASAKFTSIVAATAYIQPNGGGCNSCYRQNAGCLWFNNWDYGTTVTATGIFYKVLLQQ